MTNLYLLDSKRIGRVNDNYYTIRCVRMIDVVLELRSKHVISL